MTSPERTEGVGGGMKSTPPPRGAAAPPHSNDEGPPPAYEIPEAYFEIAAELASAYEKKP